MTPANGQEEIAARLVAMAMARGVTAAEATVSEGEEFEAQVRLGEVETLKEAGSRAAGLRVLLGQKVGSAYSSDLSEEGLQRIVESATSLAAISMADPHAGLPEPSDLGKLDRDLGLYSDSIGALETAFKIEQARAGEQAAMAVDPRIDNSEGGSFGSYTGWRAFANSLGFLGSYRTSSCSMSVVPVASVEGRRERDYWSSSARSFDRLEAADYIGRKAAERVLRRLGARKASTQKVPVVFEPRVARSLVGHIFSAVSGDSVYRKASYLAGKVGERVANPLVTIIDDGTMPGLFGTSPFDDEGVASRRTTVVGQGVLTNYLLNTYTARKLGMRTTGNASRGITGNASVGHGNMFLEPGENSPEAIIRSVKNGLYVTELLGSGVNIVNGDYSRGAAGVWIENGELTWPVHEITISGNLCRMFEQIEAVGDDLEFRGSVACPTLLVGEMTVSGH
ncbi:TldD/PmbA family protein [uncultured Paludibaculum sp.]|uniref:TldD/PmbA family protein n=1 Tax=uncultured Paludibaculum sp. TaxID=1765020 RepID=UPI002AAB51F0|nr:TldD/PmbA family protein [uncultured Paludibaculum sp.]